MTKFLHTFLFSHVLATFSTAVTVHWLHHPVFTRPNWWPFLKILKRLFLCWEVLLATCPTPDKRTTPYRPFATKRNGSKSDVNWTKKRPLSQTKTGQGLVRRSRPAVCCSCSLEAAGRTSGAARHGAALFLTVVSLLLTVCQQHTCIFNKRTYTPMNQLHGARSL